MSQPSAARVGRSRTPRILVATGVLIALAVLAAGCRPGPSTNPVAITRANNVVIGDSITFQAQWDGDLIGAALRADGMRANVVDGLPGRQAAHDEWLSKLGPSGVTVLALGVNDVIAAVDGVPEAVWSSYFAWLFGDRIAKAQSAGAQCVVLQRPDGRSWWIHGIGNPTRQGRMQRAAGVLARQMETLDGRRGVALSAWVPPVDGTTDGVHLTRAAEQAWSEWLSADIAWLRTHRC